MTVSLVLVASALFILLDQLVKLWALSALVGTSSVVVIPGVLQLTYVENRGAAFGILQGRVGILSIITLIVLVAAIVALLMGKFKNKLVIWSVGLIIAGGAGNLIDRMYRGFVVDYFDITPLFNFPVFNFADCCVVVGTIMLMIYLLFFEGRKKKEEPPQTSQQDGEQIG